MAPEAGGFHRNILMTSATELILGIHWMIFTRGGLGGMTVDAFHQAVALIAFAISHSVITIMLEVVHVIAPDDFSWRHTGIHAFGF